MTKDNVIDFKTRKKKKQAAQEAKGPVSGAGSILDITERRKEIITEERRQVKRTILTGFLGAFVVVPERGLVRVSIHDISVDGMSFDTETKMGHFKDGEEVAMRVYMNHKTYFPFNATVKNVRSLDHEGAFRHGVQFMKGTVNERALFHFIKFIENVSAHLLTDNGDVMVSNLQD